MTSPSGNGRLDPIDFEDFERVQLVVGTIVDVQAFPQARQPAYKLQVDFGEPIGTLRSSARITVLYRPDELLGRQVQAVVNFPVKQIGPFLSECLVTGYAGEDGAIVLVGPDRRVPNGTRLS